MEVQAGKSKLITGLIQTLKRQRRKERKVAIDTINALMLPRGYVYIDGDDDQGLIVHFVMLNPPPRYNFPRAMSLNADVIWNANTVSGVWTIEKDRTGLYEPYSPFNLNVEELRPPLLSGQ